MKLFKFLTVILLVLLTGACFSQWQKISIVEGSNIKAMSKDSMNYIYALTTNNQVFRSSDNGGTWQNFTNGINVSLKCIISTPYSILIGTWGNGIYRSTNHGQNWITSNSGISTDYDESFCVKGNFVFSGNQDGVYRSSNDGLNWIYTNSGIGFTHGISAMISCGNYLFAESHVGSGGTMFISTNNGDNWIASNSGLPTFFMSSLAYCDNKVFTADMTSKVYQTTDYGLNWILTPGLPGGNSPQSVSAWGSTVTSNYYQLVYISTNCGSSFVLSNIGLPAGYVYSCLITNEGIFAATSKGVYKSNNSGLNWFGSNSGFSNVDFLSVISIENIVIAGSNGYGVYRSTNSGSSWNLISALNNNSTCNSFFIDGSRIYAYGTFGLVSSSDNGVNWSVIPKPIPLAIKSYFVSDSLIFVGIDNYGMYKTTNFGVNWVQCNSGLTNNYINAVLKKDNDYYCLTRDFSMSTTGFYKTTNMGNNWNLIASNCLSVYTNFIVLNQNVFYAGQDDFGIYLSTNEGYNWVSKNNGLPSYPNANAILFKNGVTYVGTQEYGIYKSTNNLETWVQYNEGISNYQIKALASGTSLLYAGGSGSFYIRDPLVSTIKNSDFLPRDFILYQNFPNPFNPTTRIKFSIPNYEGSKMDVSLIIYDILGNKLTILIKELLNPGTYEVEWNGSNYPSGIYYYKLIMGNYTETKKMVLIK